MNTVPTPAELAADVARLREMVLDLGDEVTSLTLTIAELSARLRGEPVPAAPVSTPVLRLVTP